ncbi:hypothetical protein HTG_00960 [Natrinema mahii]|nr:hypothetical protein HTG_00960 [Natrinema mahii]
MFELDLFLIDRNVIWLSGEILVVVSGVRLVPVLDRSSVSIDAEPLTEVSTFRQ